MSGNIRMIRYEFYVAICTVVIFQFACGFNNKWANRQFEKIKDDKLTWTWLKIFKVPETKENFFKFARIISAMVIMAMIFNIVLLIIKNR